MFRRLKCYTVHTKPGAQWSRENLLFVPEGFHFWAFLLTFFWSGYHRMWKYTAMILLANVAMALASDALSLSHVSMTILQLGFNAFIGFDAPDRLRTALSQRGFVMADIVVAESHGKAELRYLDRLFATPVRA